ncbi:hypothetical protein GCM10028862_21880 [Luteimonas pelagia]
MPATRKAPRRPAWRHAGLSRSGPAAALLAALLGTAAAPAQVDTSRAYLDRMDGDGDGRVSLAEYQAWMGYAFARMDRDGDGVLAPHELPGGRGRPVDRASHLRALAAAFARQDADRDGLLDAAELAAPPR